MKVKEQPIEEIKRLRQEVAKLRQEKTERKRVEEKLHASEEQYRELFESAPESITLVGFDGTILNVNNASEIITGLPREEIIGKRFTELGVVHEKDLPKYTESLSQLASGESIQPYKVELTFKGGKTCWLEIFSGLLKKDNRPYAVQVITRDITERKKAEAARRESEARYNALFDRTLYCVYVHDFEGRFLDANDAALKLLGYTREEVPSLNINISSLLGEDQLPTALKTLEEIQQTGRQKGTNEFRLRTKDGNYVWVETEACLVYRGEEPYAIQGIARDITERKKAQETLQESEEQYRNLFQTATDGIVTLDVTGRVTSCNKKTEEIFGYKQEELIGKHFTALLPEKEAPRMSKGFQRVLEGKTTTYQTEIKTKSGDLVRVEVTTVALRRDAEVIGALEMMRDITDRKQAEEALKESEEKYRTQFEQAMDAIALADAETGIVIDCNRAACKLVGRKKSEIVGQHQRILHPPQEMEGELTTTFKQHLGEKEGKTVETQVITKNGEIKEVAIKANIIEFRGKKLLQGIFRDITERKQAEEMLRQSEKKYRNILENITDGYYELDLAGNLTFFNDSLCQTLGYTRDELMSMNNRQYMDEENAAKVYQIFNEVYRTGKPCTRVDWDVIRKDGTKLSISSSVSLIRDSQGKPIGFRGLSRDITERKQAEEALKESEEKYRTQFEQAMDAIIIADTETGIVIDCNRAACKLVGRKKSEIVGQHQRILHPPQEMEGELTTTFKQHLGEKEGKTVETQVITKNGEIKEVAIKANIIEFRGKKLLQGIFRDITERKQAEKTLQEAKTRFEDLFETANELIITTDAEGWVLHVNKEVEKLSGYSKKELVGQSILNIAYPEDRDNYIQFWQDILSGLNPHYHLKGISKTGNVFDLLASGSAIRKDGNVVEIQYNAKDITEEKQAEETLRRSEEKYRTILENTVEGYYEVDLAGNFTFFNDSLCKILGYSRNELLSMNNRDYMDKENARRLYQAFNKVYTTGKPTVGIDWETIRKDGTKRFIETSASLIRDARGEPTGFRGVVRDITEHKQAEEKLQASEERYRNLFENATDGIFTLDLETRFTSGNKKAQEMCGYNKGELIGQYATVILPEEEIPRMADAFKRVLKGEINTYDTKIITKNGDLIPVEVTSSPIEVDGEIVGTMGMARDITERKRWEKMLRESEARYRTILENTVEGYYEVDLAGNFTFVNDSICADIGYSRDELIGMNNRDYMDEQTAKKVLERFAEVYTTGQPARGFDFEVIRKDGTKLFISSSISLIRDSKGEPTGFRGVVRDITEEKQAEEKLQASEERYRNLFENATDGIFTLDLKTRFTSGNKKAQEMCGYNKEELIGQYATVILPEEEIPRIADAFKKVLKGEINTYETKIITKNGDLIPVEVTSSPIEVDGEIVGIIGMARDITERKRWEEMLRRSEEKYRTIIENTVEGYYEADLAGNFTFVNDPICAKLGYSRDELLGMKNRDYMDKQTAKKVLERFGEVYTTGQPARGFDFEVIRKDGTKIFISSSISLIRDSKGEPTGFRGVVRDITEEKQAEEMLQRSEEKYRTILESITEGYYEVDLAGNFTFFNDSTCKMLGYSKNEMMGMNDRQYLDKENARKVYKVFNRVYTTGKPSVGVDWEIIRKDGTKRFIGASTSLLRDAQGNPTGFRGVIRDVTERKQAEEVLRESKEKYRQLTEEINDTIYTLDKDGTVTYVSPVIEWFSGYSPSEIMGRSFAQFLHEEELLHIIEDYGHTLSGHSTEGEYRFRTKSGEIRWAGISNRPIFAGDRVVGARGTITDITKRKLAEQASEEARTRFEDLFETANELIITTDAEGWVLRLNKEVEKLSGYSKKELVGQSILTIAYPEDTPKYIQFWKDILIGLDPHYELRAISAKKHGDIRYLLASGSAIRKDGKVIEIQYNVKDITEEKQVEEKLRQSEEKYRSILENITDGYYELDLAGNFTFFNDSMCKILGYSKNEMMGMNNRDYMDKENARKVHQTFNKVYTIGKPAEGFDWELTRKDGTKRIVEASITLIRNPEGEPIGFRGIVRDITERKQMEAEKNELEKKAQLATRLGVIGEMASGIVHEINNPLTSVIGFTEMLAQKELPEDAKEYVRIINSEGKRVAGIASRLLNFSRHQNPGRAYTDINKLIEATIELQQYEMTSGNIKITAKLDPHLPRTMADPGQMQQVFLNILLNARTAMRLAHGGGKLLINTKAMDNTIHISFKDDGPGIAKKNLQRIFYPFFTTRKSGEGTGLGLSICQNIIATHDGTIYARSKLGKGATFIIKLPVVARQRKTAGNGGANHINGNPWR